MKSSTLLALSLPVLSNAWTITWRNAEGKESTKSGHGPSKCIQIDHAKGQEFDIDGEGEPNINMLLFTNDKCSGEPSGQASVSFVKEASSDLSGFQVVRLDGDDDEDEDDDDSTSTGTGTGSSSGSATPSPTSTSTDDDDDETITLPTVSATSTSSDADETTSPSETASSSGAGAEPTESSDATGTDSDATPSPSESGDDSTPTDGSVQLGLSRTGLAGVVVAAIAGGWALDMLF